MPSTASKHPRRRPEKKIRAGGEGRSAELGRNRIAAAFLSDPLAVRIGIWLIGAVHGLGVVLIFKPVKSVFDASPLIDQDWGLHLHHLKSMEAFWRDGHRLWGYNPFFMAGYPSNTIQDLSIKFFEIAALVLSTFALTPIQWFKLTAYLAMASTPWLIYFTARNFFYAHESKPAIALGAALLATLYWWNSLPREMFFYGMIGFPAAAYVSIWGVSLFYRIAHERKAITPAHFGWFAFAVIILPLHVQSLLIVLPALLAFIIIEPKLFLRNLVISLLGAAALALSANSVWLLPAIVHRGDDVSRTIVEQLPLFASTDQLTFLIDYIGTKGYWTFRPALLEKGLRLTLLILGVLGVRALTRNGQRSLGILLACGIAGLFLLSYFGSFIPALHAWQPLRFKVPLDLFLSIGTAYAIARQWQHGDVMKPRLMPLLLGGAAITFAFNVAQSESSGHMRLRSQLAPDLVRIIDWIKHETPAAGRVLFEESGDESGFVYDGVYLSTFAAAASERQLIGGPINLYNDRHHFAEFHSGKLFKRDIGDLADSELRNYLRLYNIGAIVTFHPASLKRWQSLPGLVVLDQRVGPVYLLRVNQELNWFVEGQGKVTAGLNRLELGELAGNPVILKYHWVARLKSEPAARIESIKLADDPIPFIKIINPPPALSLRLD